MILLLLACTGTPEDTGTIDPLSWPVDEDGPFNVGFRTWEFEYTPTGREARTVTMNLWYPTNDTSGPSGEYLEAFEDEAVFRDAEPAPSVYEGGYPVHVHSHGYSAYGGASAHLFRRYASHGWVVASPDHTGNTIDAHQDRMPTGYNWVRIQDLTATLDLVHEELDVRDEALVSGHSYGGYTAYGAAGGTLDLEHWQQQCEEHQDCDDNDLVQFERGAADPRFTSVMAIAGSGWGRIAPEGYEALQGPAMMLTGGDDGWSGEQSIWDETSAAPLVWVHFEDVCHNGFTIGGCSLIENDEVWKMTDHYAFAMGRSILDDDGVDGVLDGSIEVDSRATVKAR